MSKSIFITGGSKGIGLAVAKRFFEEGFEVGICARGKVALKRAREEMPGIHTYICDLSQKQEVLDLAEQVNRDLENLEVLVNNGGIFVPGGVHDAPIEVFEEVMNVNLNSAFYVTQALVPGMKEQQRGMIVNMCSVASIKAYPNGGIYSTSKFALLGFSKSLREELKTEGIRVVSVLPGAVFTASWEGTDLPEERFMPVEDIASMVWDVYKLSNRSVVEEIVIRPALGDI